MCGTFSGKTRIFRHWKHRLFSAKLQTRLEWQRGNEFLGEHLSIFAKNRGNWHWAADWVPKSWPETICFNCRTIRRLHFWGWMRFAMQFPHGLWACLVTCCTCFDVLNFNFIFFECFSQRTCHWPNHDKFFCTKPCPRSCPNGHKCKELCHPVTF